MPDFQGIARAAYFRVSSLALATYEYVRMIPTAVDFYLLQWQRRKITVPLVLFVLLRVTSILLTIISNYAIYFPHWTVESCSKFFLASPILKLLQLTISQCIMTLRTYNLAGRQKPMGVFLLSLLISTVLLQWVCILFNNRLALERLDPPVVGIRGSCLPATIKHGFVTWSFYCIALVFDLVVSVICAYYLIKYKRMVRATFLSNVMNTMIYEGLFYFVGLTAINITNLVFMQSPSFAVDVTAVGMGYTLVWILSQNIVLGQYRAQEGRSSLALVDKPEKFQPTPGPYTPEPSSGPSGEIRGKRGYSSDKHGESFALKILVTVEEHSDRYGGVTGASCSTRPSDLEAATSGNRIHSPSEGEVVEYKVS